MNTLLLDEKELNEVKNMSGALHIKDVKFVTILNSYGCDRYDCFFRGTQCPCEGICDGKQ